MTDYPDKPCIPLARLQERLVAERELQSVRLRALETATVRAREEMERRLESMNEFRDALKDQTARFPTRDEVKASIIPILEDVRTLRESRAELSGKASQQAVTISLIIGSAGIAVGAIGLLLRIIG